MYQDLFLRMDYQQVVITNAPTQSYIDMLSIGDAVNGGSVILWKVLVTTTFTLASTGTNAHTLQFQLHTDNVTTFQSSAALTLAQSTAIVITNLVAQSSSAGAAPTATASQYTVAVCAPLPYGCLRYVRGYYVVASTSPTINAGAVTNELILDSDKIVTSTLGFLPK